MGHTGGLINPCPWRGRCRAGYSNTGGPPLPRKRAPCKKPVQDKLIFSSVNQNLPFSGSRIIFDDFRESYWWLRQNTPEDAKIMSWWDYGYQITSMANRTILVDNNTWNNTHISRVGQAMASNEEDAYEIMRELDVDYVLVIFGGLIGYSSDGKISR